MDDAADLPLARDLLVTRSQWLAEGIMGLSFSDPSGAPLPRWNAGSHIDVTLPSGQIRSYSLCGTPDSGTYDIAVLLEAEGRGGSRELHRTQLVGHKLPVRGPRCDFPLDFTADHHLFIAGGVGITPVLPMIRTLAAEGRRWTLYYLGKQRARMAFLPEISTLSGGNAHVFAGDTGERMNIEQVLDCGALGTTVYCCGPERLMAAAETASTTRGLAFRMERFGRPDLQKPVVQEPPLHGEDDTAPIDPDGTFEVEMRATGVTITISPGQSILGEARKQRQGLSFNCADGYCGTCETAVISGCPDHRDTVLSDEERAANETMMICVSRACTRKLVLDL
ncbi:PDR/VanB family oxidoreductase [Falsirhodobacter sp. alg1]|uniref:PDR/VanB family oxidoreductase n=1 Tax=Falsirhodobacter sp. alg1 TaxID=1472418 RepID=UPI0005EDD8FA|nr:PDR/VanB family oxidoreductase [Falsirhodobacter sp. alg1]